jgi:Glycosyl hydrolase family 1.
MSLPLLPGTDMVQDGRCLSDASANYSDQCAVNGGGGNYSVEPYQTVHIITLSHAKAVQTYRNKYKPTQKGQIG